MSAMLKQWDALLMQTLASSLYLFQSTTLNEKTTSLTVQHMLFNKKEGPPYMFITSNKHVSELTTLNHYCISQSVIQSIKIFSNPLN